MNLLSGSKTNLTVLLIVVLLVCHWKQWLVLPTEAYAGLFALAMMFLRFAVSKASETPTTTVTTNTNETKS
jgi:hypothetical protein